MTEPTFSDVWAVLELNPQFLGAYGPKGEPCLTNEEKRTICAIATKRLKLCYEANPDFFGELWPIYRRSLAVQNWFARNTEGKLFSSQVLVGASYNQASRMALKKIKDRQPKTIVELIPQVVQETF